MTDPPSPGARLGLTWYRWLLVGVAVFFVVSFALSWLRSIEFQTTTWDEGLYQQALWSAAHGRAFYEAADLETGGYESLLQVHSVFVLYLVVPLYAVLPYQATLFGVQSAVVAAAAVPLYLLARDVTGSPRLGLVAGVMYLAWTPILASTLYDFHPEAFLPLELFSVVLLWQRRRYGWGLVAAAVSFATFEFAPVLTFFVAVFALLGGFTGHSASVVDGSASGEPNGRSFRAWIGDAGARASLALLGASVAAYAVLLYLRVDYLTAVLGTQALPQSATGYLIGATPAGLDLAWGNLPYGIEMKVGYWLLGLALLAFVPLLAPRALVLSIPWLVFTLFSGMLNYVTLGFQYGFIAATSLLVAFVYGLPVARRLLAAARDRWARGRTHDATARAPSAPSRRARIGLVVGLAALLAVNVALTPLDPAMQNLNWGSAYRLSFSPSPTNSEVEQLVALVPAGATVVASDDLFPLVADDENAYSFSWIADPYLYFPFGAADPPSFVLVAEDRTPAVSSWLTPLLYNASVYGVRGVVWASDAGSVLLFESGYSGAPASFGTTPTPDGPYFGAAAVPGPAGRVVSAADSSYSEVVRSVLGESGAVWYGPDASLPAGSYRIELSVNATTPPGSAAPGMDAPVLSISSRAFATADLYNRTLTWNALGAQGWATVEFNVSLSEPVVQFTITGTQLDDSVETTLNFLAVQPEA